MTHANLIHIFRWSDHFYNRYCHLSVTLRHGLGPARPEDHPILRDLREMNPKRFRQLELPTPEDLPL